VSEITRSVELTEATQKAVVNEFLRQQNATSPEDLIQIVRSSGLSEDAFFEQLFRPARMTKIAQEQFGAKAEARFLAQKERLDRVVYSLLRLNSESQAQELYLRIAHGEAEFSELASRYSQGPERNTQGMIGPSPLNQAHPALSEKLRAAKPGSLLEPFPIERWWVVARLERFAPASFDERMADQMSMELLQEWVKQETTRTLGELINDASGTDRS
ncbi:MAG: peptidylprolyl isomerase, partial [Synechococcaceae bacterium WB9_4xB_025]|nr:peptidylprolyl isomerase [Synechococcaceae bacterium WB9_4xB_025]